MRAALRRVWYLGIGVLMAVGLFVAAQTRDDGDEARGVEALRRAGYTETVLVGHAADAFGPVELTADRVAELVRRKTPPDARQPDEEDSDIFNGCDRCPVPFERGPGGETFDAGVAQTPPPTSWFTIAARPKDPQIAASTTHLVVTAGSRMYFYEKSGDIIGSGIDVIDFFKPITPLANMKRDLPLQFDPNDQSMWLDTISDARVIFDGFRKRFWVVAQLINGLADPDEDGPLINPGCIPGSDVDPETNETIPTCPAKRHMIVVAVSTTENPMDAWHKYVWPEILNNGNGGCAANCTQEWNGDYPSIGISDQYFVVENLAGIKRPKAETSYYRRVVIAPANLFASGGVCNGCLREYGDLDGTAYDVPGVDALVRPDGCPSGGLSDLLQPAVHHDNNLFPGAVFFVNTVVMDSCHGGTTDYRVLIWALYPGLNFLFQNSVAVEPWHSGGQHPETSNTGVLEIDGYQRAVPSIAPTHFIQFGNMRNLVLKAAFRDGHIYATWQDCRDTSGDSDSICEAEIRLFRAHVLSLQNVIDRRFGTFNPIEDPPGTVNAYGTPAVEVNKDGDIVVVYLRTGKSIFPEARYSAYPHDAPDILPSALLQKGEYPYGKTAVAGAQKAAGRLDTAGISVDPFDDTAIWMIHAYGAKDTVDKGTWRFAIGKVFGRAHPDLMPSFLNEPLQPTNTGGSLQVDVDVRNQGDGPAGASVLNLYYSDDAFVAPNVDPLVGTAVVGPLVPGDHQGVTFNVVLPTVATAGSRFLIAWADANVAISEYTDSNNFDQAALRVTGKGGRGQ